MLELAEILILQWCCWSYFSL